MHCRCGHKVVHAKEKNMSYVVVDNCDYKKFIKSEKKVLEAKNSELKLDAIANSAQYIGNLYICPECDRLIFVPPHGDETLYYRKEE